MRATYEFVCMASGGVNTFWPELNEAQPAQAMPGQEVKVTGSGSYTSTVGCPLHDGTRTPMRQSVKLLFDRQTVSDMACSVERCEGVFTVPPEAQPGPHSLSTEGGSEIEILVLEMTPPPSPSGPGCPAGETAETVWPQLNEIQPARAVPGGAVKVIGSGGYVRCGDSGYNESARSFQLFFDGAAAAQFSCYVNHCEAELTLPGEASAGTHTISVEGGSSLEVEIASP